MIWIRCVYIYIYIYIYIYSIHIDIYLSVCLFIYIYYHHYHYVTICTIRRTALCVLISLNKRELSFFEKKISLHFSRGRELFCSCSKYLANKTDRVGFILTTFHEFREITWDFRTWGVRPKTYLRRTKVARSRSFQFLMEIS